MTTVAYSMLDQEEKRKQEEFWRGGISDVLPKKYGTIYNNAERIAVYNKEERGLLLKKYRDKKGKRVW